jgi:uncharacterized protein YlxW (UPF0749 family)
MQNGASSQWYGYVIGGLATLLAGSWLGVWVQGWWSRKKTGAETDALSIKNYENAEKFFQQMMTKLAVLQFGALKLKQEIAEKDERILAYEEQVRDLMRQGRSLQEHNRKLYEQIGKQSEELRQLKGKR